MVAFEYDRRNSFINAIKWRYTDQLAATPLEITRREVVDMLVRDKHKAVLAEANELAMHSVEEIGTTWHHDDRDSSIPNMLFRFKEPLSYLLPRYSTQGPVKGQCPEVQHRVNEWVARVVSIQKNYATVVCALEIMRDNLQDMAEVRFYFPGILTLLGDIDAQKERDKLTKPRMVEIYQRLDPGLRPILKIANETIARSTLFPKAAKKRDAEVTTSMTFHGSFNRCGVDIAYL